MKRATEDTELWIQNYFISIHALVKRATSKISAVRSTVDISIHALVKRATLSRGEHCNNRRNFNPRPREEGDTKKLVGDLDYKIISIHALVKRATANDRSFLLFHVISIHALVKRATTTLA